MIYGVLLAAHVVVMTLALVHALIYKRDHRAALGWIGMIIVFPLAGPLLYFLFGINRIRTVARRFSGHRLPFLNFGTERHVRPRPPYVPADEQALPTVMKVGQQTAGAPLSSHNRLELCINGEQFFPRLIAAIDSAQQLVLLSSYLFSPKGIGGEVIAALGRAANRGVRVLVLIDGTGALYSLRGARRSLRKAGVSVAEFIPLSLLPPSFSINLRNHRKIATIDGRVGFFGGINIDPRHMVDDPDNRQPTEDIQFEAHGPVVADLQAVFAEDWAMATGQTLSDLPPVIAGKGSTYCRVIDDGPDENLDALAMTLLGVFSAARKRISIMMPYFLPSREMIAALQSASLRGVQVRIVLPERSNLRFIDWATRNLLWELLLWDVVVYYKPAPFSHSKLIVIDDHYVLGGSANLDPRSLRLNFELGVEMLDTELAAQVQAHIETAMAHGRRVTLAELDHRPLWQRMRDAFFWLFSSYL